VRKFLNLVEMAFSFVKYPLDPKVALLLDLLIRN